MKIIPLLLALGLAVGGAVVPSAPNPVNDGSVTVIAAPVFAGVLRPGQALVVSGTVTNTMAQAVDAGTATVYVSSSPLTTRDSLALWLSDDHDPTELLPGNPLGSLALGELAPGQARSFSVTVPARALASLGDRSGVFPLSVRLTSDGVTLTTTRSAISWDTADEVPRVNLAVATKIVAPAGSTGIIDAAALEQLTGVDGLLAQQLDTALAHTVAIGVDPMVVASIRILGDGAPPVARLWLERLEAAPNDVFSLSYADSDQVLLHHAGASSPLEPFSFPLQNGTFPEPAPTGGAAAPATADGTLTPDQLVAVRTTIDGLAWPITEDVTEDDLDYLAQGGFTRTLVPSTRIAGSTVGVPRATVGGHDLVVTDSEVSALVDLAVTAATESQWTNAIARLTATLAVTAAQHPGATVVSTTGQVASSNVRMLNSTLNALDSLPWASPTRLSTALTAPSASGSLAPAEATGDRLALAKSLLSSERSLAAFSSVANDPTLITGPERLALLALVSGSWITDPSGWQGAVQEHLAANSQLLTSVNIPESSSITLLQEKGNLPITVRNELDFPVTVFVAVRPERAILDVLDDRVELTVEANSQSKASIPVQSIANGEVRTTVALSSATGVAISSPTVVVLNVQAGWETAATVALSVIVLALFAAGIVRTVLRRRQRRATLNTERNPES